MPRRGVMAKQCVLAAVIAITFGCRASAADAGVDDLPATAAATELTEAFAVHGQFTYVEQETDGFHAPYRGPNSLSPRRGAETTDATVYLGARLGGNAEIWFNPEVDQGFGLDNTLGLAGFSSGEAYKVGKNLPYLRMPRLFVRDTVNLRGEVENIDSGPNQLGGVRSVNRWVFWAGKFSVGDVFDINQYAHDPRADFFNWSVIDGGSFDYAADAWGYSVGAAAEWYAGNSTLRAGLFDLSNVPNSAHLDPGFHEYQVIVEFENRHEIAGRPGKIMLTAFDSRGRMALLRDAVALAQLTGSAVDGVPVRRYRSRLGAGLNLEQQLSADVGLFARLGKAAGNVEAYEFTDIDRSISAGLSLKGTAWARVHDTVGAAVVRNGVSAARERYLDAGGLGILVGDGQLPHPGQEHILETFYNVAVVPHAQLTFDYQWFVNPAYNRDRGPVSVFAVRLHLQF